MRTFVALDLPDPVRDALEAVQEALPPGLRPSDPDQFHLTLAFLGERPESEVEAAHEGLETLRHPRVPLRLRGLGTFDHEGLTVWAGVAEEAGLRSLQAKVLSVLHGAGIMLPRRRFRPHVTLARARRGAPDPDRLAAVLARWDSFPSPPFEAREVGLWRSTLRPDGALHEELARYPLG